MFLFLFLLIYEDFIYFFQVPKEWVLDPGWDEEDGFNEKGTLSYMRKCPSKWSPQRSFPDPNNNAQVIDHFVVERL